MTMRIRIKEACQFYGRVYERGEEVTLPDGVRGPHRTVRQSPDVQSGDSDNYSTDANRIRGQLCDVALYEELPDQPEGHSERQQVEADRAAKMRADAMARRAEREKLAEPVPPQRRPGTRIRLREVCQFGGRLCAAGEVVLLPDGIKGPHRATRKSQDRIDYRTNPPIDANRILGEIEDVPLYDVLPDEPEGHSKEQQAEADRAAKMRADTVPRQKVTHD
jgi:hypothetical protein